MLLFIDELSRTYISSEESRIRNNQLRQRKEETNLNETNIDICAYCIRIIIIIIRSMQYSSTSAYMTRWESKRNLFSGFAHWENIKHFYSQRAIYDSYVHVQLDVRPTWFNANAFVCTLHQVQNHHHRPKKYILISFLILFFHLNGNFIHVWHLHGSF